MLVNLILSTGLPQLEEKEVSTTSMRVKCLIYLLSSDSVVGYSFDYVAYNISGYLFYSIYTVTSYIQQDRLGLTRAVEPNDVAFALHGVALMIILIFQCLIYEREEQRVHPAHGVAVACMWIGAILNCFLAYVPLLFHPSAY